MIPETDAPKSNLYERVVDLLQSQHVAYRVIEHEPIDGSARGSSAVSGTRPEQGAKALIMMVDNRQPIMVVVRGTDRANIKAVKKFINSSDVRLAIPEEIQRFTHSEIGVLPAIGDLFDAPTYVDKNLLDEDEIVFGSGLRVKTIAICADDYMRVFNPIVGVFSVNGT